MKNVLIATVVTAVVGSLVVYRLNTSRESSGIGLIDAAMWPVAPAGRAADASPDPLSAAERRVKRELESTVGQRTGVDRVVRTNGREVRGQIVEENDQCVKILQSFGDSGDMTLTIRREDIRGVHRAAEDVPAISIRDVRFKTEFPKLNLYRRPPYTIMTSQSYFDVEDVTRLLNGLHDEFIDVFAPVITKPELDDGIQLLFFTEEKAYRAYQRKHAPGMEFTVGFYNPRIDRFVIYDRKTSSEVKRAEKQLDSIKTQLEQRYKSRQVSNALKVWQHGEASNLHHNANQSTRQTLRHEGAHQLFHTYGVHSEHDAENLWLVEGLAVYCENERIGNRPLGRIESLRDTVKQRGHIPFPKLVNFRSPRGFGGIGSGNNAVLQAYAQSWFIVDFAMRRHKNQLFDYIRYVRDPRNAGPLAKQSRFETLAGFFETTPAELDRVLIDELKRL